MGTGCLWAADAVTCIDQTWKAKIFRSGVFKVAARHWIVSCYSTPSLSCMPVSASSLHTNQLDLPHNLPANFCASPGQAHHSDWTLMFNIFFFSSIFALFSNCSNPPLFWARSLLSTHVCPFGLKAVLGCWTLLAPCLKTRKCVSTSHMQSGASWMHSLAETQDTSKNNCLHSIGSNSAVPYAKRQESGS